MHVLIAKVDGHNHQVFLQEHPLVAWSPVERSPHVMVAVEAALKVLFIPQRANDPSARYNLRNQTNFTFSERPAEIVMDNFAESPEELSKVDDSVSLQILARREGHAGDDRWARLHRWPSGGRLAGLGIACTEVGLRATILDWFDDGQEYKTFGSPNRFVTRDPFPREFYLRPTWSAPAILPNEFALAKPPLKLDRAGQEEANTAKKKRMLQLSRDAAAAKRETASWEAHKNTQAAWLTKRLSGKK